MLWYGLFVVMVTLVYRRFMDQSAAGIAGFLFAVSFMHSVNVGWLAARYGLFLLAYASFPPRLNSGKPSPESHC